MKAPVIAVLMLSGMWTMTVDAQEFRGPQRIVDCVVQGTTGQADAEDCHQSSARMVPITLQVPDFQPEVADDYWYRVNRFTEHSSGSGGATPDRDGLLVREEWLQLNRDGVTEKMHTWLMTIHKGTGEMRYTMDLADAPLLGLVMSLNNAMRAAENQLLMADAPRPLNGPRPQGPRSPSPTLHDPTARAIHVSLDGEHMSGAQVILLLQDISGCRLKPDENGFVLIASCSRP